MVLSGSSESLLASYTFAFSGVMLVLYEQHVHVLLSDPATYSSVFHHKCGLTMLAGMAWAGFESVMFTATLLRERQYDREHRARLQAMPKTTRAAYPYARAAQTSAP